MVGQVVDIVYPIELTPTAVWIGKCALGVHIPHRNLIIPGMPLKIQHTECNEKPLRASQPRSLKEITVS